MNHKGSEISSARLRAHRDPVCLIDLVNSGGSSMGCCGSDGSATSRSGSDRRRIVDSWMISGLLNADGDETKVYSCCRVLIWACDRSSKY